MTVQLQNAREKSHGFYLGAAVLLSILVFVGFGPTFYFKVFSAEAAFSSVIWLHGTLFTAWMLVLLAQTLLVSAGRVDLHMRLGWLGAAIGAAMIGVGFETAVVAGRLGHAPPGVPPLPFMVIPIFAIIEFAILFGLAILLRARSETHKRLILLATIVISAAGIARLPIPIAGSPPGFFAIADLFIIAGMIYDWRTYGRVHPVYKIAGTLVILSQPVQLMLMGTEGWLGVANWLIA